MVVVSRVSVYANLGLLGQCNVSSLTLLLPIV